MSRASKALREELLSRYAPPQKATRPKVKKPKVQVAPINCNKTTLMLFIERQFGCNIESLIWGDSIRHLAVKFGVSEATVTYWRRKFPIEQYTTGANGRKYPISEPN